MTILKVVQDVCAVVGIPLPASVFTNLSGTRTMQEMLALANEMAQRIAYDTRDWNMLRKVQILTGNGVLGFTGGGSTGGFPLPADFKRMLLTSNVWRSTSNLSPMRFVPDTDTWLMSRAQNIYSSFGEWTMLGGQLLIAPVMPVGQTAYFSYMDKNCVNLAGGGVGAEFQSDGDSFRLDERVLKLGMIWQWKAQKGSPYNEDLGTYGDALSVAMGHDSPAPIYIGSKPISAGVRGTYPFGVPT